MTKSLSRAGDRIHQLREELLGICQQANRYAFRMGEILKEIRDKKLWEGQYESFRAFYSDEEISLEESSVFRAIQLVERFPGLSERLAHVPVSKLYTIMPHVNKDNREQLIEMASSLSRSDLIHQLQPGEKEKAIGDDLALPKIYRCNQCKRIKGVSFSQLCHCGWTPKQIEIVSKAIDKIELGEL